jgi:phosphoribosyl 1,2-cyclic phosphate phosphodiesterase
MEVVFLGTGTSQGIPVIGCSCDVCLSEEAKDNRLRTSVLVKSDGLNILIDVSPDFRRQMLDNNEDKVDVILLTHEHNDHIIGMDDIRPVNFKYEKNIPVYGMGRVLEQVRQKFHYAFSDSGYPGAPRLNCVEIEAGKSFWLNESLEIIPLLVFHAGLPILGFRIHDFVYITDASHLPEETISAVTGVDVLVINALQRTKHFSHFNLEEALEMIRLLHPSRAFLTHMSHQMGKHKTISDDLPGHVEPAFDKMRLKI